MASFRPTFLKEKKYTLASEWPLSTLKNRIPMVKNIFTIDLKYIYFLKMGGGLLGKLLVPILIQ